MNPGPGEFHSLTNLARQRICVVGAGGFIGRAVVKVLAQSGALVVAFDRNIPPGGYPSEVRSTEGNALDPATLAENFAGCDTVIYLANVSVPATANSDMTSEILASVAGPVQAAQIAIAAGCKRFLFSSSGGTVYGAQAEIPTPETAATRPMNAYGVSKLAAEHYLRVLAETGQISVAALRISNPYGEHQEGRNQGFVAAAIRSALLHQPLTIFGNLDVVRDFIYVRDVANAVALACDGPNGWTVLNVGSGSGHSLGQILSLIETESDLPIKLEIIQGRSVDVAVNILDTTQVQSTLGWRPLVGMKEGIRLTIDWWRENLTMA
jgi:UDP-glucose 4-epimerase